MKEIHVRGARTHNLKNIEISIPRDKFIVITGLSGSGKSSLAFDTLYAEGQRRYVESLSTYARQFLSLMEKPDVDHIEGLSPAISIEQKSTSHNPRSTVGTITEIYDYLRLLFARVGIPKCPTHDHSLEAETISQMVDRVMTLNTNSRWMLLAPVVLQKKGEHIELINQLKAQGFIRARIDNKIVELDDAPKLTRNIKHSIEVVVDRFKIKEDIKLRLAESFEIALNLCEHSLKLVNIDQSHSDELLFSSKYSCPECQFSIPDLEPRMFSFNNPLGACSSCDGLGVKQFFDVDRVIVSDELSLSEGAIRGWDKRNTYYFQSLSALAEACDFSLNLPFKELSTSAQQLILYSSKNKKITMNYINDKGDITTKQQRFEGVVPNLERRYHETESDIIREEISKYLNISKCPDCHGSRLNQNARCVYIENITLPELGQLSIGELFQTMSQLNISGKRGEIAEKILKEIRDRLHFLVNVGLDYLSLDRGAESLSGGEAQRIRLASQIGAGLVGVMYVLDEPSIGLHQRDNERLLSTLTHLRDLGNTVIVVEHDEDSIRIADHVIDIGPGAGVHGGEIIASGTVADICKSKRSITGEFLSGKRKINIPDSRQEIDPKRTLSLIGASGNNLNSVNLNIPLGLFTCITGVSGSGKSTLINHTLYPLAATTLNGASTLNAKEYQSIEGLDALDKVVDINQSPIGRTPRSNPATYTGLFTGIRELFAGTHEARSRGYKPGRFSFNVKGGRCEACHGDGVTKVEMHFLPDMFVTCDVCHGKRYNRETLEIHYKGKSITEVLGMTVEEAADFFSALPALKRKLNTLLNVGLSYIKLGQAATTLSGGEAQRIKLAKELSKRDTGNTLYILDEPTTGLHFHDIDQLLKVLHHLRDHGNTIVVIEHNLDVIKTADWIIDLGPEGGAGGGEIIAEGKPEELINNNKSHTARFLRPLLQ